jgi:hypothetical protein
VLVALPPAFATCPVQARQVLVPNFGNYTVGEYNATTTGATIDATFITSTQGLSGPTSLALDSSNHLFVANNRNNTVGEYDATTGATINATFINSTQGLNSPTGLRVVPAPEPGTLALLGVAAVAGGWRLRKRFAWGRRSAPDAVRVDDVEPLGPRGVERGAENNGVNLVKPGVISELLLARARLEPPLQREGRQARDRGNILGECVPALAIPSHAGSVQQETRISEAGHTVVRDMEVARLVVAVAHVEGRSGTAAAEGRRAGLDEPIFQNRNRLRRRHPGATAAINHNFAFTPATSWTRNGRLQKCSCELPHSFTQPVT